MFSYDTDLTLDSVMVGKTTTIRNEVIQDNKFYETYLEVKRQLKYLPNGKSVIDEPVDHENSLLLYNLFGEINDRLKTYKFYQDYSMGIVYNCECCGIDLNILNRTPYTICKKCDNIDGDYETQLGFLNV